MSKNTKLAETKSSAELNPVKIHERGEQASSEMSIFSDQNSFETALKMANVLSQSTVVPKDYQGNEGNCLIAIEMAARINTSPMMVMQNLYVVNGRPGWSSQWIIAMINTSRKYKTELQFEFGYDEKDGGLSCYAYAEDYSGHIVKGPKISMKMAKDEGWLGKSGSKWKTMPEVMIRYRAASFFGRVNCPDMIMGIYSQEEVIDGFDDDIPGDTILTLDENTGEVIETEYVEDLPITQEQRQELFAVAKSKFGKDTNEKLMQMLSEEGYESTTKLPTSVWNRIKERIEKIGEAGETA